MAYEARRDNDPEKQRDHENAKKTAEAVAKGAGAYFGGAKGAKVVGMAAKTKAGGKILDTMANRIESNKMLNGLSNKLNNSGAVDAANKAMDSSGAKGGSTRASGQNGNQNTNTSGGGQKDSSLPSSGDSLDSNNSKKKDEEENKEEQSEEAKSGGIARFIGGSIVKTIAILFLPFFLILLIFMVLIASVSNLVGEFEDAVGISEITGGETGDMPFVAGTLEQNDFYNRVNTSKLKYQAQGKTIDPLKVVAVFHVLERNGANVDYDKMDDAKIDEIANSMFEGSMYSDDAFKNNLISSIIPKYLPKTSQKERESIVEEVFEYIDNYYNLIEKEAPNYSCSNSGSCSYDIKGFYIKGSGNVSKKLNISDLYVRLMQCGTADGHNYGGTFGQPLAGEDLVPFEKYILGVAYQEIGPDAPAEAIKAQMVAARSYILARHVDIGGWRTLKQENGRWVLQVASCTQDQVYCDPDQGCSSNDGQWGQVHSGLNYNRGFSRGPMAADSPLRTYASQTQGELLVNSQGYVVYADYGQSEQNQFSSLAKKGLNYKQILLQVYNQGKRNYGANNIQKSSCSGGKSNCVSSGEFANWRQYSQPWASVKIANSNKTIKDIGCLVTSVAILVQKSGVNTNIPNFNPGTFVEKLNQNGGFSSGGFFQWHSATKIIPSFQYQGKVVLTGYTKEQKLNKIKEIVNTPGVYAVAEVKSPGEHWVAIDSVDGNTIRMIDPGSNNADMWGTYGWNATSEISYYKVS